MKYGCKLKMNGSYNTDILGCPKYTAKKKKIFPVGRADFMGKERTT